MKNKTIVRAGWATKVFPVLALLSFVAIGSAAIVRAGWATKVFPVLALLSFVAIGSAANVNATNPAAVQDTLTVTVDSNCSLTTGGGSYTKSMNPGSTGTITGNTITAVCNDAGGYAIYAVGYSGDSTSGNNTDLISTSNGNFNIKTDGSYQESYWKMSFTASGQATVTSPYTAYQQIPVTWAKVASYNEYTTSGSVVPHYQIHFGEGQPAGTYTGKVQYVLVNPSSAAAPFAGPNMQNLSASQCTTTPSQVKDTRDGHVYTIQRLKDGPPTPISPPQLLPPHLIVGRRTLEQELMVPVN